MFCYEDFVLEEIIYDGLHVIAIVNTREFRFLRDV